VELYLHSPCTSSWRGAQIEKHRGNFTFTFTFTFLYEYETWSITVKEEHNLLVFENLVLRRIFRPNERSKRKSEKAINENFIISTLRQIL